jgi:hypothetical protein
VVDSGRGDHHNIRGVEAECDAGTRVEVQESTRGGHRSGPEHLMGSSHGVVNANDSDHVAARLVATDG